MNIKYKNSEHVAKTPKPASHQNINDILINPDDNDDDEASSKTKCKLSRTIIFLNFKFNYSNQVISSINPFSIGFINNIKQNSPVSSLFSKTSISIATRCLRI